ncbi:hypothetical protein [Streptomyces hirsutus]
MTLEDVEDVEAADAVDAGCAKSLEKTALVGVEKLRVESAGCGQL